MNTKISHFVLLALLVSSLFFITSQAMAQDLVISQCLAPQGNGGNFASTLGWMSETLEIRVNEAMEIEKTTGQTVKFHLGCMTGGSSGSLSTSIMMNILQNQNLFPGAHTDRLFSIEETQIIADALRFMSLNADAPALEMLNTYRQVIVENIEGKVLSTLGKNSVLNDFARNVLGNKTPTWWDEQTVDGDQVLVDFLTLSLLASAMDPALLYGEDRAGIDYEQLFEDAMFSGRSLVHLQRFSSFNEIPRSGGNRSNYLSATEDLKKKAQELNSRADTFISSLFPFGAFKSRYLFGAYNASKSLKNVAEQPMAPGFCTITMGIIYPDASDIDLDHAPNYDDIRPIVMCSAETIDTILEQPDFLNDLKENTYLKNFILAEAKNLRGALALSLREPGMMSELIGEVGSKRIELNSFYDPAIHMAPGRNAFNGHAVAVLGGWPDRRISAWLSSYYLLNNVEKLRAQGYEVKGYISMFGKPDNRLVDKFDTRSIKNIFSSDPEDAIKNLADWFDFQDNYCSSFLPRFKDRAVEDETVAFNWDISKIPAAQSGNSRFLTAISINATELQNPHRIGRFVFDTYADDGYIEDFDEIPCTY